MRKMRQKLLIFMIMICAVLLSNKTYAEEKPEIRLNVIENTELKTTDIEVVINNNPGITAYRFEIEYDDKVMKLVDAVFSEASTEFNTEKSQYFKSPYSISGYNANKDVTLNGKIAVLKFEMLDTVNTGKYPVSVKYDAEDIFNMKGENILFEISDSKDKENDIKDNTTAPDIPNNQVITDNNKVDNNIVYTNISDNKNDNTKDTLTVKKPNKIKGLKIKKYKKKMKVSWKKLSGIKGYRVLISTGKKFLKKTTITKYATGKKVTIKKLKPNKIYYVKVCGYKVVNGKKVYGSYSGVKKIKFR